MIQVQSELRVMCIKRFNEDEFKQFTRTPRWGFRNVIDSFLSVFVSKSVSFERFRNFKQT